MLCFKKQIKRIIDNIKYEKLYYLLAKIGLAKGKILILLMFLI